MSGGYYWRGPSGLSWGLRLLAFSLLVLVCFLTAPRLSGQSTNDGEPLSMRQRLQRAELSLTLLVPRMEERERETIALRNSLLLSEQSIRTLSSGWQEKWEGAQSTQELLRLDLQETSTSLARQETISERLSKGWKDYREFARGQIADLERQELWWKIGATVAGVGAIAAMVWALVK